MALSNIRREPRREITETVICNALERRGIHLRPKNRK